MFTDWFDLNAAYCKYVMGFPDNAQGARMFQDRCNKYKSLSYFVDGNVDSLLADCLGFGSCHT